MMHQTSFCLEEEGSLFEFWSELLSFIDLHKWTIGLLIVIKGALTFIFVIVQVKSVFLKQT